MFKKLYNWYMKTFLPFEDPSHPLYSDGSIKYDDEMCETIAQFIDDELEAMDHERINSMIGPNYSRPMGGKPFEYEKWGNKWYKKS